MMNRSGTGKGVDWGFSDGKKGDGQPLHVALFTQGFSIKFFFAVVISIFSIVIPLYAVYLGLFGTGEAHFTRSLVVTLLLVWAFLSKPLTAAPWHSRPGWVLAIDILCILLTIFVQAYVFLNIDRYAEGVYNVSHLDMAVGLTLIILILEATRRCFGIVLSLLGVFFVIHPLYGSYFPGLFSVRPSSFPSFIEGIFISSNGIYGLAIGVFLTFIVVFMLFGALVQECRAGSFFNSLASGLMGRRAGGPAKIAVLSSGFMATITGAGVANVATTGTVTIPLMKKSGLSSQYAGGVEAVASTGGQIMPPIMGVTAFVMASIVGVSYLKICISAFIPACLFYLSLYFVVHFKSRRDGLSGLPKDQLPQVARVLKEGAHLLIPFVVLSYMLIVGYTPLRACLWGVFSMFLLSFIRKETRLDAIGVLRMLAKCSTTAAPIGVACATIGIILGSIGISGLGFKFSSFVIAQSGGYLLPALIFCMIASIILGMGMPPLLVYISLALMVIPAVVQMGVNVIAAHLFVFYYAVISGITPPVALVAYTAAGIAQSNPFGTGVTAFKIGLPVMMVPFMFAYSPELLIIGTPVHIAFAIVSACVGIICFAAAIAGWFIKETRVFERFLLVAASVMFVKSGIVTDLLGVLILGAVIISQKVIKSADKEKMAAQ